MKEQDLLLNSLANPQFSVADFVTLGFNADNTTMGSESDYLNNDLVKEKFTKEDGTFDKSGFHNAYMQTLAIYNTMANDKQNEYFKQQYDYHKDDIFAPLNIELDKAKRENENKVFLIANPFRLTVGLNRLGQRGKQKYSEDEIAQTQKVWDPESKTWHDSPNDSWFTDFWDTRVLAQYDENVDVDGNVIEDPNDPNIVHHKGELKLNENGTYYYENLAGRSIYGRRVLNKLNTLTVDGSPLNKYDFFDSDGIDQKNPVGVLMKNAALVGSMFIPYVGPWIAGMSAMTQVANLGAVLGKMIGGSENPTLSAIEGWTNSVNRQTAKSQYAQQHTWCWENMIDVTADLMAQLKELRFLFEYVPMLVKGNKMKHGWNWGFNDEGMKELQTKLAEDYYKLNSKPIVEAFKAKDFYKSQKLAQRLSKVAVADAQAAVNAYQKSYYKIGEVLGKTYMAGLISSLLYSEMKMNGVSDFDASMFTLGRFAAEMALLATPMGNYILPELRADKLHLKGIAKGLTKLEGEEGKLNPLFSTIKKESAKIADGVDKEAKISWYKKLYDWGASTADRGASILTADTTRATWAASLSNGIEVGVVNDIEEFFNDMAKQLYNIKAYVADDLAKMNPWEEIVDRYGMGLVSGVVGGTLTSAWTNYGTAKQTNNYNFKLAWEQLIYLDRNGQLGDFYKILDKVNLAPTNLSYKGEIDPNTGEYIHTAANTYEESQDYALKKMIRDQLNAVHLIMQSEGLQISDDSFLKGQFNLLGDLRFGELAKSTTASRMLLQLNSTCAEIFDLNNKIRGMESSSEVETDRQKLHKEKENSEEKSPQQEAEKKNTSEMKKRLKELVDYKNDLLAGKFAQEYIRDAVFEMSPQLSEALGLNCSLQTYAEAVEHKKWSEIAPQRQKILKDNYKKWKESDKKDNVHILAEMFQNICLLSSEIMNQHANDYEAMKNDPSISSLNAFLYGGEEGVAYHLMSLNEGMDYNSALDNAIIHKTRNLLTFLNDELLKRPTITTKLDEYTNQIALINVDESLSKVERENQIQSLFAEYEAFLGSTLASTMNDVLANYLNLGFMNTEGKLAFNRAIDEIVEFYEKDCGILVELGKTQGYIAYLNDQLKYGVDDQIIAERAVAQDSLKRLKENKTAINNLPNTPIELQLNQFSLAVTGKETNISQLIDTIQKVLESRTSDTFTLGGDTLKQLNDAIQLVDLYRASIEAAKTDNLNEDNLFGFNHVNNEAATKALTEGWIPLAEISTEVANMFHVDLNMLNNKLNFFKHLYEINKSLKLNEQKRVSLNKDYIFFNKFKSLLTLIKTHLNDWSDRDLLENAFENSRLLKENSEEKIQGLSPEEMKQIEAERIAIEDAIFEFFQKNNVKTMSVEKLSLLISPEMFDFFNDPNELLTEGTPSIDDNSYIWYLATRAAVKATDFYGEYQLVILTEGDKIIAPIAPQELAIYNNYASVVNGDIFSKFADAYQYSLKKYWKSAPIKPDPNKPTVKSREEILERLQLPDTYTDKKYDDVILSIIPGVTYKNIVLTEGIPGSGKSTGVYQTTIKMLKTFHPDSKYLKNVAIVHGGSKSSAEKLRSDLGFNEDVKAFSVNEFMKEIVNNHKELKVKEKKNKDESITYVVPENYVELDSNGELKCTASLNKTDNPFTLVIIDEITNVSTPDLDMIDSYGLNYGVSILGAGDMDQSGIVGKAEINKGVFAGSNMNLAMTRINFARSPKLGVSLRTANCWKSENTHLMQHIVSHPLQHFGSYAAEGIENTLKYYLDETGIYGDKVYNLNDITYDDQMKEGADLIKDVEFLFSLLKEGERIGYIWANKDTPLYKYIMDHHANLVEAFEGSSAQGREGKYFIIEADQNSDNYLKDLYTAITRSEIGSIIVNSAYNMGQDNKWAYEKYEINSKPQGHVIEEGIDKNASIAFSKLRKTMLEELTKDSAKPVEALERTKLQRTTAEKKAPTDGKSKKGTSKPKKEETKATPEEEKAKPEPEVIEEKGPGPKDEEVEVIENGISGVGEGVKNAANSISEEIKNETAIRALNIWAGVLKSETEQLVKENPDLTVEQFLDKEIAETSNPKNQEYLRRMKTIPECQLKIQGYIDDAKRKFAPAPNYATLKSQAYPIIEAEYAKGETPTYELVTQLGIDEATAVKLIDLYNIEFFKPTFEEKTAPETEPAVEPVKLEGDKLTDDLFRDNIAGSSWSNEEYGFTGTEEYYKFDLPIILSKEYVDKYLIGDYNGEPIYGIRVEYCNEDGEHVIEYSYEPFTNKEEFDNTLGTSSVHKTDIDYLTNGKYKHVAPKSEIPADFAPTFILTGETAGLSASERADMVETMNSRSLPRVRLGNKQDVHANLNSFNTFETGVDVDRKGYPVRINPDHYITPRIDSVNGLMWMSEHYGNLLEGGFTTKNILKLNSYINIIGELRDVLFTAGAEKTVAEAEQELNDGLLRVLRTHFNFENQNITFKFGFRSSVNQKEGQEFASDNKSKFSVFDKSSKEKGSFVTGDGNRNAEVSNKQIIVRINDGVNGDILELPLLTLPDPMSVVQLTKNQLPIFPELYQIWKSTSGNVNDKINQFLTEVLKDNNLSEKYRDIIDLFQLFKVTSNSIVEFDKGWVLARKLKSLGPDLITNDRGLMGSYEQDGFEISPEPRSLTDFANTPGVHISNIIESLSKDGTIISPTGKTLVDENGNTHLINSGNPMILYSFHPEYNSTLKMIERYIYELEHPSASKWITLAYIIPPTASIEEYIDSIHSLITTLNAPNIGNIFDAYNVMKILMSDDNFKLNLKLYRINKNGLFDQILKHLDEVNAITAEELEYHEGEDRKTFLKAQHEANLDMWRKQANILNEVRNIKQDALNLNFSLGGIFKNLLNQFVYSYDSRNHEYVKSLENLNLIIETLAKNGIENIHYSSKVPGKNSQYGEAISWTTESGNDYISPFYQIDQLPNWKIRGVNGEELDYTINGVPTSNIYDVNIGVICRDILSKLHIYENGKVIKMSKVDPTRNVIALSEKSTLNAYLNNEFAGKKLSSTPEELINPYVSKLNQITSAMPSYLLESWAEISSHAEVKSEEDLRRLINQLKQNHPNDVFVEEIAGHILAGQNPNMSLLNGMRSNWVDDTHVEFSDGENKYIGVFDPATQTIEVSQDDTKLPNPVSELISNIKDENFGSYLALVNRIPKGRGKDLFASAKSAMSAQEFIDGIKAIEGSVDNIIQKIRGANENEIEDIDLFEQQLNEIKNILENKELELSKDICDLPIKFTMKISAIKL